MALSQKLISKISKGFTDEEKLNDLAIHLLQEGKGFITSRFPSGVRRTTSVAFDVLSAWQRENGSAANGPALYDALKDLGMKALADDYQHELLSGGVSLREACAPAETFAPDAREPPEENFRLAKLNRDLILKLVDLVPSFWDKLARQLPDRTGKRDEAISDQRIREIKRSGEYHEDSERLIVVLNEWKAMSGEHTAGEVVDALERINRSTDAEAFRDYYNNKFLPRERERMQSRSSVGSRSSLSRSSAGTGSLSTPGQKTAWANTDEKEMHSQVGSIDQGESVFIVEETCRPTEHSSPSTAGSRSESSNVVFGNRDYPSQDIPPNRTWSQTEASPTHVAQTYDNTHDSRTFFAGTRPCFAGLRGRGSSAQEGDCQVIDLEHDQPSAEGEELTETSTTQPSASLSGDSTAGEAVDGLPVQQQDRNNESANVLLAGQEVPVADLTVPSSSETAGSPRVTTTEGAGAGFQTRASDDSVEDPPMSSLPRNAARPSGTNTRRSLRYQFVSTFQVGEDHGHCTLLAVTSKHGKQLPGFAKDQTALHQLFGECTQGFEFECRTAGKRAILRSGGLKEQAKQLKESMSSPTVRTSKVIFVVVETFAKLDADGQLLLYSGFDGEGMWFEANGFLKAAAGECVQDIPKIILFQVHLDASDSDHGNRIPPWSLAPNMVVVYSRTGDKESASFKTHTGQSLYVHHFCEVLCGALAEDGDEIALNELLMAVNGRVSENGGAVGCCPNFCSSLRQDILFTKLSTE